MKGDAPQPLQSGWASFSPVVSWFYLGLQVQDGAGGDLTNRHPVFQLFLTWPGGIFVLPEELVTGSICRTWEWLGCILGTQWAFERCGWSGHSCFEHMCLWRPRPGWHPIHNTVGALWNKPTLFSSPDCPRRSLRLLHPVWRQRGQGVWCSQLWGSAKHWGGESWDQLESQSAAGIFQGSHRLFCSRGQSEAAFCPEEGPGGKHKWENVPPPKCQLM